MISFSLHRSLQAILIIRTVAYNNEGFIFKKLRYISAVANSQLSICVHNCGIFTGSTFEFKGYNRDTIYKDTAVSESMKQNMGSQSRPLLDI